MPFDYQPQPLNYQPPHEARQQDRERRLRRIDGWAVVLLVAVILSGCAWAAWHARTRPTSVEQRERDWQREVLPVGK